MGYIPGERAALPVIVCAFFAARYAAANPIAALQLIAGLRDEPSGLVTLLRVRLNNAETVETQTTS